MGGRTGAAFMYLAGTSDMAAGQVQATAAQRLADSAGRLAGVCQPGWVLAVRRLDSAVAGHGGARFTVCFVLVVS